jgi:hypothetical protein
VGDVVSFGPGQPRPRPPRWLLAAAVPVALVAALIAVVTVGDRDGRRPAALPTASRTPPATAQARPDSDPTPRGPVTEPATPPCRPAGGPAPGPVAVAALALDQSGTRPGSALERCDREAATGPWTVVVRRPDGSLGRHGAVVTYPVGAVPGSHPVDVRGGVAGTAVPGAVVWPLAGAYARVRGDLTEPELVAVAAATAVRAGRPEVRPPGGLTVVFTGPYRPLTVREMRYSSTALGEQEALGAGLTYTGLTSGGGFEDELYASGVTDGGLVGEAPTVLSGVYGGSGTLAWEPAAGVVGYVGYSGSGLDGRAALALRRLAGRTRVLSTEQWLAAGPYVVDQVNGAASP